MNILPDEQKNIVKMGMKKRFIIVSLLFLASLFIISFIIILPAHFLLKQDLNSLNNNVPTDVNLKNILDAPIRIENGLKMLQFNITEPKLINILYKVFEFVNVDIKINSISFSRENVYNDEKVVGLQLSSIAKNRESLVSFSNQLKKSNYFYAVDLPVSNFTKYKDLPFSINIFINK